jgi:hypothetical protein
MLWAITCCLSLSLIHSNSVWLNFSTYVCSVVSLFCRANTSSYDSCSTKAHHSSAFCCNDIWSHILNHTIRPEVLHLVSRGKPGQAPKDKDRYVTTLGTWYYTDCTGSEFNTALHGSVESRNKSQVKKICFCMYTIHKSIRLSIKVDVSNFSWV